MIRIAHMFARQHPKYSQYIVDLTYIQEPLRNTYHTYTTIELGRFSHVHKYVCEPRLDFIT